MPNEATKIASPPGTAAAQKIPRMPKCPISANATSGPAIARFLSEDATAADYAAVMAAVPSLGVLGEAIRSRALWLRS